MSRKLLFVRIQSKNKKQHKNVVINEFLYHLTIAHNYDVEKILKNS